MDFINNGFTLFTVRGVQVRVRYVFFILLIMVATWSNSLPEQICLVVVLILSILLHEFGHMLGAWACRMDVTEVALAGLGGFTKMSNPQTPWALFFSTICGPLVNVLLAAAGILLSRFVVPHLGVGTLALYGDVGSDVMTRMNVILFLFNMLPFFPMDGGRIAQAIVWPFAGYAQSMIVAGMIGTVGGVALAGLGLGIVQIIIPFPEFTKDWLNIDHITLGGSLRDGTGGDIFMIYIGAMGAIQSFQLYRYGSALLNTRKR